MGGLGVQAARTLKGLANKAFGILETKTETILSSDIFP